MSTSEITIGSSTISTTLSGYMRSRNILIKATGLKPNTAFMPYFDNVNVNQYCVPASRVRVRLTTSKPFDSTTTAYNVNSGKNTDFGYNARYISGSDYSLKKEQASRSCLDHGDVLYAYNTSDGTQLINSPTCVVVHASSTYNITDANGDVQAYQDLYVMNFKISEYESKNDTVYYYNDRTLEPSDGGFKQGDYITTLGGSGAKGVVSGIIPNSGSSSTIFYNEGNAKISNTSSTTENFEVYSKDSVGDRGTVHTSTRPGKFLSDSEGNLQLIFWIPDINENINGSARYPQFTTGEKIFKLIDNINNTSSQAQATYTSTGVLNISSTGISSNLQALETASNDTSANNTIITDWSDSSAVSTVDGIVNPMAQTFMVKGLDGGCFLSQVKINFASIDHTMKHPITLQIRPVINGYPGSTYIKASEITMSYNEINNIINPTVNNVVNKCPTVTIQEQATSTDSNGNIVSGSLSKVYYDISRPVSFKFIDPVYLENGTEYAVVLLSESANYKVWVGTIGEKIANSDAASKTLTDRPYYGSFFKSQNASAWVAEPKQYMVMELYTAQFNTADLGTVEFSSRGNIPRKQLHDNPLELVKDSYNIRVWSSNHGFYSRGNINATGNKFSVILHSPTFENDANFNTITIDDPTNAADGGNGGIMASKLFGIELKVIDYDAESFTVGVAPRSVNGVTKSGALSSGYFGGSDITCTSRYNFDVVEPQIECNTFSSNVVNSKLSYKVGGSIDSTVVVSDDNTAQVATVAPRNTISLPTPAAVSSDSLEGAISVIASMSTSNTNLTPVFDKNRVSLTVISNIIDNPNGVQSIYTRTITSSELNTIITLPSSYRIKTVVVDQDVNVSKSDPLIFAYGDTSLAVMNSRTFEASPVIMQTQAKYVKVNKPCKLYCEYAHAAQYVTNAFTLADTANYLKVIMDLSVPTSASVEVYYKTLLVDETRSNAIEALRVIQWERLLPINSIPTINNGTFDEVPFLVTFNDDNEFNAFQLKIIMKSTNSSEVPLIRNLRMIACYG